MRTRPEHAGHTAAAKPRRICSVCGHALSQYNLDDKCFCCQDKEDEQVAAPRGFTEAQKEAIRQARRDGMPAPEIARHYGVSDATIYTICRGVKPKMKLKPRWKDTKPEPVSGPAPEPTAEEPDCYDGPCADEAASERGPSELFMAVAKSVVPTVEEAGQSLADAAKAMNSPEPEPTITSDEVERARAFMEAAEERFSSAFAGLATKALAGELPDLSLVQLAHEYGRAKGGFEVMAAMAEVG